MAVVACDWKVDGVDDNGWVSISTVDVDLDKDDQPRDFGHVLIEGTWEGRDDEWFRVKRQIESVPNMLACLKMVVADHPGAVRYAERLVKFVEGDAECGK